MAYVLKYSYQFVSALGDECEVKFLFNDPANTDHTRLNPGTKPFILKEYNSDNDFFKPIRPFQAEMEFVSNNVSIEDFAFDADDAVKVEFYFNGLIFWVGWLVQDDFQENWIDTNHYITLRATDALGQIGSQILPTMSGKYSMLDYLVYCLENTSVGNSTLTQVWVNNLFYLGMSNRTTGRNSPLSQATVDVRTFKGKNKLEILEIINKAWSMTTYQYYGDWWFARLEEWLNNKLIDGIIRGIPSRRFINSFEVNIGVNEIVKPVMPEMIKSMRRPYKYNKIIYKYEFFDEVIQNQNFQSGSIIIPTPNYSIDDWTLYRNNLNRSLAGNAQWYRKVEFSPSGEVADNYAVIKYVNGSFNFMASSPIIINKNDSFTFEIDYRVQDYTFAINQTNSIFIASIVLEDITGIKWTLRNDGNWVNSQNYNPNNSTGLSITYAVNESPNEWKTYSLTTKSIPNQGDLYIYLYNSFTFNATSNFKNLQIEMNDNTKKTTIIGDYDQYTITPNITQNYEEQTFLDDSNNRQYSGSLFFNNQLTGDNWYRMDYPTERLTFKRHKAISHMMLNRRLRRFLQVNMYGNVWLDGTRRKPIWLMNKFIFTDDAPGKKWMLANLSEMNFMEATWQGQLIEVWDNADSNDPANYPPHTYGDIYE